MDLSRAFDCMPHGLLVAKLHAYGVSPKACVFISDYLKDRMQRVKLMNTHSNWTKINRGVPQRRQFQSILLSRGSTGDFLVNVGGHSIPSNNTLKMLGVTLDDKLNLKTHIRNVCQNASRQINALKRISKILNEQCRVHVYKLFLLTNFNYCPVVWIFCGKTNLGKQKRLKKRALSTINLEKSLNYNELLKKSGQL